MLVGVILTESMKIFRFGLISFVFVEEFIVKNTNQPILRQFLIKNHQHKNQLARWRASCQFSHAENGKTFKANILWRKRELARF